MRIAVYATMVAALLAATPAPGTAQQRDSDLRDRVRDMVLDRNDGGRARGGWDWERGRDNRRDRDRDDDRRWDRDADWRTYDRRAWDREQRAFERRTRHWSRHDWNAFRKCERDLWRRSRWNARDTRREALWEARRIREVCERRVRGWSRW